MSTPLTPLAVGKSMLDCLVVQIPKITIGVRLTRYLDSVNIYYCLNFYTLDSTIAVGKF